MTQVLNTLGEVTGLIPSDSVIAHGLLSAAKVKVLAYTGAFLESSTPEIRHLLKTHLDATLAGQERIATLVVGRGWYEANSEPPELLKQAVRQADPVLS